MLLLGCKCCHIPMVVPIFTTTPEEALLNYLKWQHFGTFKFHIGFKMDCEKKESPGYGISLEGQFRTDPG